MVALLWSAVYLPTKVSVDRHKVPSKSHVADHCRGCFLLRQTRHLSESVFLQLHVNFPHLELFKTKRCRSNGVYVCRLRSPFIKCSTICKLHQIVERNISLVPKLPLVPKAIHTKGIPLLFSSGLFLTTYRDFARQGTFSVLKCFSFCKAIHE